MGKFTSRIFFIFFLFWNIARAVMCVSLNEQINQELELAISIATITIRKKCV